MKFLGIAVMAVLFFAGAPEVRAETTISRFIVTVKKVELKDASGVWVALAEPNAPIDLLAEEQPIIFRMTNDGRVPSGTYVGVRITLSETVKFSGFSNENKTKEGGVLTLGGTASKSSDIERNEVTTFRQDAPTWNVETEGLMTQHLNLDFEDRDDFMQITSKRPFAKLFTVKEKSTIKVSMILDVRRNVYYAWTDYFSGISSKAAMYFLPPADVSELIVKSDSMTAFLTGEMLEWTF